MYMCNIYIYMPEHMQNISLVSEPLCRDKSIVLFSKVSALRFVKKKTSNYT